MKEVKQKPEINNASNNILQKHSQATEEQIRYAKLSQITSTEEKNLQDKIREVLEITGKPPDIASIALHDCHYETHVAIQNILDGVYDQEEDEWETTTKKGKVKKAVSASPTPMVSEEIPDVQHKPPVKTNIPRHSDTIDLIEEPEQKAPSKLTHPTRDGGKFSARGRPPMTRSWRNEVKNQDYEKSSQLRERDSSYDRPRSLNDRGRGRGRARGFRGGRGGKGGFGRGGGFKGTQKQDREGRSKKDDYSENLEYSNDKLENGEFETAPEDTLDIAENSSTRKVEDWSDDIVDDSPSADWSKPDWAEPDRRKDSSKVFANDWSQTNGLSDWGSSELSYSSKDVKDKYIPENVDAAVIRSIPTSSTACEVTSYQPTNAINRYINTASNQFPSSHQEGGLTSSLNDHSFSLPSRTRFTDPVKRTVASMPMVTGVTESHKLEQEQLQVTKNERNKSRKFHNRYAHLPSQPVVMPRSALMVNDIEEQFSGLEFGSVPISPHAKTVDEKLKTAIVSSSTAAATTTSLEESNRHTAVPVESESLLPNTKPAQTLATKPLLSSPSAKHEPKSHTVTRPDIPKTPPGFKPLDQQAHYLGTPGRGMGQTQPTDPIAFVSNNRTPPSNSTTLNSVFSRNGGLGTVSESSSSSFKEPLTYDHDKTVNAEQIMAQQRALAEKQYLAEHQRMLSEQREKERLMADQRAFAEQKSLAQQKLLASQRSQEDRKPDVTDRNSKVDSRLGLGEGSTETSPNKFTPNENKYLSSKIPNVTTTTTSSSRNVPQLNTAVSNEMLGLTSAAGVQTTAKAYTSSTKVSTAPPSVMHQPINMYPGVPPGLIPAYQQQPLPGYNYEDLLQMQRMQVPPYGYDVPLYQAPSMTRDGLQTYAGTDPKFTRGTDDTSVGIQGNPHLAAGNLSAHQQAYLNTSQFPYGITYAYQPGVLPQGGVYPASAIYQVPQNKAGNQYQPQYPQQQQQQQQQQQHGYSNTKFSSGASNHDFNKGGYYTQAPLTQAQHGGQHAKQTQSPVTSGGIQSAVHQAVPQSAFKSHYNTDGKGFLGTSPSFNAQQAGLHLHSQPHLNNMNHFVLQQASAQQVVDTATHKSQLHGNQIHGQMQFSSQQKREQKGSYQSYWSGGNR